VTKITFRTIEFHLFCDANDLAYSASAYLRITDEQDGVHCNFVMGKCHNSPIKRLTIPRLELLAGVMVVRLSNLVQSEIDWDISNVIFWTDSTTVLQYINKSRRFHCFIATRLEEIHEYTQPEQWRYVPGRLNPADDGSRGLPVESFLSKWWSEPEFLYEDVNQWPELKIAYQLLEDDQEVLKKRVCKSISSSDSAFSQLLKRWSSWSKLRRCVSWLIRFVQHIERQCTEPAPPTHITLNEMQNAARLIVKAVQKEYFYDEFLALDSNKKTKSSSRIINLCPLLKNGVLCIGGRIEK
jgi:hypothetical protein